MLLPWRGISRVVSVLPTTTIREQATVSSTTLQSPQCCCFQQVSSLIQLMVVECSILYSTSVPHHNRMMDHFSSAGKHEKVAVWY